MILSQSESVSEKRFGDRPPTALMEWMREVNAGMVRGEGRDMVSSLLVLKGCGVLEIKRYGV